MKYLKKWKLFESHDEIHRICKEYDIENYTINGDGTIDVDGDVDLEDKGLTELPLKFNKVTGGFYCAYNQLTSLEGSPKEVDGFFECNNNKLITLKGCPKHVSGHFSCHDNQLISLEGVLNIGDSLFCQHNQLINLDHLPNVSIYIYMGWNPVSSIVVSWIFDPKQRWERWEYFQDLNIIQGDKVILERLKEFHEVMEIKMPDLNEIKKYYTIVE